MDNSTVKRKRPISFQEETQWLNDFEAGKGITFIANKAKRDIRVVKNHIELARERRLKEQAKQEYFKYLIIQHQEDLLGEAARLKKDAKQYPPSQLEPADPAAKALYEALKQHLKRHRLSSLLGAYNRSVEEYELSVQTARDNVSQEEVNLISSLNKGISTYPWTTAITELLQQGLPFKEDDMPVYSNNKSSDDSYKPSWNAHNLTKSSVTAAESQKVVEAHNKLVNYAHSSLPQFELHRQQISELARLISNEVDILLIKHTIVGKCEFCPV